MRKKDELKQVYINIIHKVYTDNKDLCLKISNAIKHDKGKEINSYCRDLRAICKGYLKENNITDEEMAIMQENFYNWYASCEEF